DRDVGRRDRRQGGADHRPDGIGLDSRAARDRADCRRGDLRRRGDRPPFAAPIVDRLANDGADRGGELTAAVRGGAGDRGVLTWHEKLHTVTRCEGERWTTRRG